MKELWSGVGNDTSFLLSRPSLLNALASVGFSSAYECFNPPHLNFGSPGLEHVNRCTFVALKGRSIALATSPVANHLQEPWPEGTLSYSAAGRGKRLRRRLQRVFD